MTTQHNNLINGEWLAGTGYSANLNPSNLADVIGEYAQADVAQLPQRRVEFGRAGHGQRRAERRRAGIEQG